MHILTTLLRSSPKMKIFESKMKREEIGKAKNDTEKIRGKKIEFCNFWGKESNISSPMWTDIDPAP
jgi:hypothetical protein